MEANCSADGNEPEACSKDVKEKPGDTPQIDLQHMDNLVDTSQSDPQYMDHEDVEEADERQEHNPSSVFSEESDTLQQTGAASGAEEHIITSPSGRRYVAHIYGEGDHATDRENDAEGSMARKLCLNLLTEFMKGRQRVQKEPNEQAEKADGASAATKKARTLKHYEPQQKHEQEMTKANSPMTNCTDNDSTSDSEKDEPPFKKAKFAWQIKKSQPCDPESSSSDSTDHEVVEYDTRENDHNMTSNSECCVSDISPHDSDSEDGPPTSESPDSGSSPVPTFRANGSPSNYRKKVTRAKPRNIRYDSVQRHHIAKSIVDNAINKTLEEMGLSPDQVGNRVREQIRQQRQRIEAVAVAEVIRERGLHGPQPQSTSFPSLRQPPSDFENPSTTTANAARRLYPLIHRLTEVSENMFVRNIRRGVHVSTRIELGQGSATETVHDDDDIQIPQTSANNDPPPESAKEKGEENAGTITDTSSHVDTPSSGNSVENCNCCSTYCESQTSDDVTVVKSEVDVEQIEEETISSSYVLDKALNAAITERGLHY